MGSFFVIAYRKAGAEWFRSCEICRKIILPLEILVFWMKIRENKSYGYYHVPGEIRNDKEKLYEDGIPPAAKPHAAAVCIGE